MLKIAVSTWPGTALVDCEIMQQNFPETTQFSSSYLRSSQLPRGGSTFQRRGLLLQRSDRTRRRIYEDGGVEGMVNESKLKTLRAPR